MGEKVISSPKEHIQSVKPTGGFTSSAGTAYKILRSVADLKKGQRIRKALLAKLKLCKASLTTKVGTPNGGSLRQGKIAYKRQ